MFAPVDITSPGFRSKAAVVDCFGFHFIISLEKEFLDGQLQFSCTVRILASQAAANRFYYR